MQTLIAGFLWLFDIILCLDDTDILLFLDQFRDFINIIYIRTNGAHADQVIDFLDVYKRQIKDWPKMPALADNLVLKVVSEIHDPVTTTDELIPSGETSSFRSNPLGLAEFTLSRKDPAYVGRAKEIQKAQKALEAGE